MPATTIAVPSDSNLLAQRVRQKLAERGWSLTSYDPQALQGNRDYQRLAQRARFRLTLSATRIGDCRDDSPSFLYNLAVIENLDGNVRVALTGANCLDTAIERFEDAMDRKQLDAHQRVTRALAPRPGSDC